ncbi:hypothetical protein [Nocardia sp. SYP-A9097]|nr:hypothetical protein [Nocardia sp. SYP-A9097]
MDPTGKGDQPEPVEGFKQFNESAENKADQEHPDQPWKSSR